MERGHEVPVEGGAAESAGTAGGTRVVLRSTFAVCALIGLVYGLVAVRAAWLTTVAAGEQPDLVLDPKVEPVPFDLRDASGVPLGTTVEYLELTASPTALWQAHTPLRLMPALANALGMELPELQARLLPDVGADGWVVAEGRPFPISQDAAQRVQAWIKSGRVSSEDELGSPLAGVQLVADAKRGGWTLRWRPLVVLSAEERARQGQDKAVKWTRRFADDLALCILGPNLEAALPDDLARDRFRNTLWAALMPTGFKSVVKEVPPSHVQAVYELLKKESVQSHQMELVRHKKRAYPARSDAQSMAIVGRWGTFEKDDAAARAAAALSLPPDEAAWSDEERADYDALRRALVYVPRPMNGLELYVERLLQSEPYVTWTRREGERYLAERRSAARQATHRHFVALEPADEPVQVETTLELPVQAVMKAELERVLEKHEPALAMGIAVDVATGDVLACDYVDPYEMGGFAPTQHTFTPGSTMKAIVMAAALTEGVIEPTSTFDAAHGHYSYDGRLIREAEGGDRFGVVTAAQGLAHSLNAVMVQIGTRMDSDVLEKHFLDLGYERVPGMGLGYERKGFVPTLRHPRTKKWSHASTCFGHEMSVTLWQHATALATMLRGGKYRPLRLVRAVEQYGARREIPLVEDHPLQAQESLSLEACNQVREMMNLGAREGTGKKLFREDMVMGTKTGTAQKVPGEICLHLELKHNREHGCRGARACREQLKGKTDHGAKSCYTSSICIFGRRPHGEREVMVLVVVEEAKKGGRYGSEIAGPAGLAVLRESLGLTRGGVESRLLDEKGFNVVDPKGEDRRRTSEGAHDHPWAEDVRASR